jgi:hypothetical protein
MATEPWLVWSKEMEVQKFDMTLMENSPRMPKQLFRDCMGKHSHLVCMVVGPELLGWPVRRPRLFSMALNRETLAWVGPMDDDTAFKAFSHMFCKRAVVDADAFSEVDTPEAVRQERLARASLAGLPAAAAEDSPLKDYIKTAKGKERLAKYISMCEKRTGHISGSTIVDLSQNPQKRFRASPWMMTITRSTDLALLRKGDPYGYFYTPGEVGFSQGWPTVALKSTLQYKSSIGFPLGQLSRRQQVHLQGNGMHLTALTSFIAYVFAHTIHRDLVAEFLPPLRRLAPACKPEHDEAAEQDAEATFEFVQGGSQASL